MINKQKKRTKYNFTLRMSAVNTYKISFKANIALLWI